MLLWHPGRQPLSPARARVHLTGGALTVGKIYTVRAPAGPFCRNPGDGDVPGARYPAFPPAFPVFSDLGAKYACRCSCRKYGFSVETTVENKRLNLLTIGMLLALAGGSADAAYVRINKMFDVSQTLRPEWGSEWCAPTGVGNSFAWLAKEYGLTGLVKVNGTGAGMSAADVIDEIGKVDMKTVPNPIPGDGSGTRRAVVEQAKKDYIKRHGLEGRIKVESMVAIPTLNAAGELTGYTGTRVTKKWLKDQFDKGQDVEFAVSYYEKVNGKMVRKGGHVEVFDGQIPGEASGGHQLTLAGILDPSGSDADSDFGITFTDPGRNDLAGEFGALTADQYSLTDFVGDFYFNTASTYQVTFDANLFGLGDGALLLDGYQGNGDFAADGAARRLYTVLEAGWAESPIPEPSAISLLMLGLFGFVTKGWKQSAGK
jgi:hypothetical protein